MKTRRPIADTDEQAEVPIQVRHLRTPKSIKFRIRREVIRSKPRRTDTQD